jgi:4-amino-4-deoxy-L-arabinose transferase-like glycosyltransferase
MGYVLLLTCLWSVVGAWVLSVGAGKPQMAYVLVLALWSVVGALVFFVRANISLTQRLALTIGTSVALGVIGWVHMSNIYDSARSGLTSVATETGQAADRSSPGANGLSPSR